MSRSPSGGLERRTIVVGGAERTYWMAPQPAPPAPLLMVLHGMGLKGPHMAAWTGLAVRGPAAGFATVFPDAVGEMWDDTGRGRVDGIDDAGFVADLIDRLVSEGNAKDGVVFLAGLSNGAFFAEHLARHGIVRSSGVILVAGTARQAGLQGAPRPAQPAALLCIEGTTDPMVPYGGGRASGLLSWMARRRARRYLLHSDGRDVVAVETLTADWAATNGCSPVPSTEPVPGDPREMRVNRLSWTAPGHAPVVLYRI